MDPVEDKILGIIAAVKRLPRDTISLDSSFEQLGIDSLDGMNILFEVEGAFDISIPDDEAKRIRSVGEMVEGVRKLLAAGAGSPAVTP